MPDRPPVTGSSLCQLVPWPAFSAPGNISGIQLKPLMNLEEKVVFAWEAHLRVVSHGRQCSVEKRMNLFNWKIQTLLALEAPGLYLVTLPSDALIVPEYLNQLIEYKNKDRLMVQLAASDLTASQQRPALVKGIKVMRENGWKVWIENVTPELAHDLGALCMTVDGITLSAEVPVRQRKAIIHQLALNGEKLLIKDIRTEEHYEQSLEQGAGYGQGALWPERTIYARPPTTALQQSRTLRPVLRICLLMRDRLFAKGVIHLLLKCLERAGVAGITEVSSVAMADMVISEGRPGEAPVLSWRWRVWKKRPIVVLALTGQQKKNSRAKIPDDVFLFNRKDDKANIAEILIKALLKTVAQKSLSQSEQGYSCRACLTEAEYQVAWYTGKGLNAEAIAEIVGCSNKRVYQHRQAAMRKLQIDRSIDWIRYVNWLAERLPGPGKRGGKLFSRPPPVSIQAAQ